MPGSAAAVILEAQLIGVIGDALALLVLECHQPGQLLGGKAVGIVHGTTWVGGGDDAGPQLHRFLDGVLGHVARARHWHRHASQRLAAMGQHGLGEIEQAVAGGLRANETATKGEPLAGKDALGAVGEPLHHAGHVAHLAPADADVTGRHVGVGPQVAMKLQHQCLAEAHHLSLALALGIEIAASLATAHGQCGEGILEGLFEGEELEHREIHRGVKTHPPLEGANGGAVLDAVAAVHLHLALIVHPADAKLDQPLRLYQSLQQAMLQIAGMALDIGPDGGKHLADRLNKLRLVGIAAGDLRQEVRPG